VAGLYLNSVEGEEKSRKMMDQDLFKRIVGLRQGESLLFCPTAAMKVVEGKVVRMLDEVVTLRTRERFTEDGGLTRLADGV
jgi:hypothetical protein